MTFIKTVIQTSKIEIINEQKQNYLLKKTCAVLNMSLNHFYIEVVW